MGSEPMTLAVLLRLTNAERRSHWDLKGHSEE